MNVLVYSGRGSTIESIKHAVDLLRQCLLPYYAVITISESALLKDPWISKSSLLVIPGGADLPYCSALNGAGNERISRFVRGGGKFLGLCAGGYYALARVEFEVGNAEMEVSGARELAFYPGTSRGCVYRAFVYGSHAGVRAAELKVNVGALPRECPENVVAYYNGGGMFVDASKHRGVEVLARYTGPIDIPEDEDRAAVVYCKVGNGDVVLSGVHPEFAPALIKPGADDHAFQQAVDKLRLVDSGRRQFLAGCLAKLGLRVNTDGAASVPRLTPLYILSYSDPLRAIRLWEDLHQNLDFVGRETFEDAHDTFVFHREDEDELQYACGGTDDLFDDVVSGRKHVQILTSQQLPDARNTPYFSMHAYFEQLCALYDANNIGADGRSFGSLLCYGEVVTLTNTLLDANPGWLQYVPTGFTFTATTQIAGRGRGGNVWINPNGVMATSLVFRVRAGATQSSSIVTLQYLCALALVELVLGYGSTTQGVGVGYEDMPVRLKWPNDIYALKPEFYGTISDKDEVCATLDGHERRWAKISGSLVNSQFIDGEFVLVWGGGVNVLNEAPTTSLNLVLARLIELRAQSGLPPLPEYRHEALLARVVYTMGRFFEVFQHSGLHPFLQLYYKRWLHLHQRVKVDANGDGRTRDCQIQGISADHGMLIAEDVHTREVLELQPDGNSFDVFNGLVYKKRQ